MASTTQNLILNTIDGSDVIDPEVLNANMRILDALGVDYVVESGTSGEWYYTKWKSGKAECYIPEKNFGDLTDYASFREWRRYPTITFGAYPFTFAQKPNVMINLTKFDTGSFLGSPVYHDASESQSPNFYYVDPWGGTVKNARFSIYVVGRWK